MFNPPAKTWNDAWNDVIRDVIFPDEQLKRLMLIPEDTNILTFVKKYFIESNFANDPLIKQDVRIVYGEAPGHYYNRNCLTAVMQFDIFVKDEFVYSLTGQIGDDALKKRQCAIADRLRYLLMKNRNDHGFTSGLRIDVVADYGMGTTTKGYKRWHLVAQYPKFY